MLTKMLLYRSSVQHNRVTRTTSDVTHQHHSTDDIPRTTSDLTHIHSSDNQIDANYLPQNNDEIDTKYNKDSPNQSSFSTDATCPKFNLDLDSRMDISGSQVISHPSTPMYITHKRFEDLSAMEEEANIALSRSSSVSTEDVSVDRSASMISLSASTSSVSEIGRGNVLLLCPVTNVDMTYSVTLVRPYINTSVHPSHFS